MADESPKAQILGGYAACVTNALSRLRITTACRGTTRSTHRSAWALWERTPLLMDFARSALGVRCVLPAQGGFSDFGFARESHELRQRQIAECQRSAAPKPCAKAGHLRTPAFRHILSEIVTISLLKDGGALIRHIRDNSLPGSPPRRPAEPRPVKSWRRGRIGALPLRPKADAFRLGRCQAKTPFGNKISGKL
jgi:hypothetical protein